MAGCGMVRACMARVAVDAIDGMLHVYLYMLIHVPYTSSRWS